MTQANSPLAVGDRAANGRAFNLLAASREGWALAQQVRGWWTTHTSYTVTVSQGDPFFQDVSDWLAGRLEPVKLKAVRASTGRGDMMLPSPEDEETPAAVLQLTYDQRTAQKMRVGQHTVTVTLERDDSDTGEGRRRELTPDRLVFRTSTEGGRDAVVEEMRRILADRRTVRRRPALWQTTNWGGWTKRKDLPARTWESVILPVDQAERLRTDLGRFLGDEERYNRLGIPWHRGYLLHGPPGTGKTSIVKALSNEFGLDLWYISLGDLDKDQSLMTLLAEVHPRSILLLEDVDVYQAARARDAAETGAQVTTSGLLNALDGVATPHGLISILTTNDMTVLDQALVRSGRVDLTEEICCPGSAEADRLFTAYYGRAPRHALRPAGRSTAEVAEIFKRNLDDPGAAERALFLEVAAG